MTVFVTGGTGYIGGVVLEKLRAAGHDVTGLARSSAAARKLESLGATPVRGDLRDAATLTSAARASDGVIHLAMESSPESPRLDRTLVEAAVEGLRGSGKPFLYTSGIWVLGSTAGCIADEATPLNPPPLVAWRPAHENRVLRAEGIRGIVIRPAMVYGRGGGFAGDFARSAREHGVVRYVGTGENHWPFVHVDDLADLYLLALEHAPAGALYFAAAGPSLPVAEIARAAARGARMESISLEVARKTMGPLADALTLDQSIDAGKATRELGWKPKARSIREELAS
jgi:nucleoside-diphosphate-sugar epimerase